MNVRIVDLGDSCVIIELEPRVDPHINGACLAIAEELAHHGFLGIRDIVVTYHSVAVHIDPLIADRDAVAEALRHAALTRTTPLDCAPTAHDIFVQYGGEFGPDLEDVAKFAGCHAEEVIRLHSEPTYRVYMVGFLPGFAYLGKVDERIAMPRYDTPRMRVAAGSVGIAGFQTGIYPSDSPGGWRIIGRTTTRPFDPSRSHPFLFRAGDTVRFIPAVTR